MSKFTEGERNVNTMPLPARGYIEISGGDSLRLRMLDVRRGKHYKTSEVMEANARLIADAPQLLADYDDLRKRLGDRHFGAVLDEAEEKQLRADLERREQEVRQRDIELAEAQAEIKQLCALTTDLRKRVATVLRPFAIVGAELPDHWQQDKPVKAQTGLPHLPTVRQYKAVYKLLKEIDP